MCVLYMIGLGVIPSRWTRRGLRARTAWDSWFYWRPRSQGPRRPSPTSSKRTTVPFDRSWQGKPTRMWCVNSAPTLPPRWNSPEATCVSDRIAWAEKRILILLQRQRTSAPDIPRSFFTLWPAFLLNTGSSLLFLKPIWFIFYVCVYVCFYLSMYPFVSLCLYVL